MSDKDLIAPCGMNCGICKFYYREKNTCKGCRSLDKKNSITRYNCIIRECKILKDKKLKYCSDKCDNYPCKRLIALNKRYNTKYHMSMLKNLEYIKKHGIDKFLDKEKQNWECPKCNEIITCHGGMCLTCGYVKFKN